MEDDNQIQSPHSPAGESPCSPWANGRMMVTVPASAPPQNNLGVALPVQQQQPRGNGGGGGGREDCWSEGATVELIDAWGERYLELGRGYLTQKHWKEIADTVSSREDYGKTPKTDTQCKYRMDTVKKKYKLEKSKIAGGDGPSKWQFYERLHQLIDPKISDSTGAAGVSKADNLSTIGIRAVNQNPYQAHQRLHKHRPQMKTPSQKIQFWKRAPVNPDWSPSDREPSPVSNDSFPPGTSETKRPKVPRLINSDAVETKDKGWVSAVRELTQAVLKLGEAYEQAEWWKIEQVAEMEKQKMRFAKEMELQRMQFFMKTQMEILQMKHRRRGGGGGGNASNHHSKINSNINNLVSLD